MTSTETTPAVIDKPNHPVVMDTGPFANWLDSNKYNHLWRAAQMLASSDLVPDHFKNKPANCFIATQMAIRLGVEPMMMLQKTYIVHGKPGIESTLALALVNASGVFDGSPEYVFEGQGESRQCYAKATETTTGREKVGPTITVKQAKASGWWASNVNWQHHTDLMLSYRACLWMIRTTHPEVLMGMMTQDELIDVGIPKVVSTQPVRTAADAKADMDAAKQLAAQKTDAETVVMPPVDLHGPTVEPPPPDMPQDKTDTNTPPPMNPEIQKMADALVNLLMEKAGVGKVAAKRRLNDFASTMHSLTLLECNHDMLTSMTAKVESGVIAVEAKNV